MSKVICILLLSLMSFDLNDIAKINSLKKKAETAFNDGEFEEAVKHYSYLLDTMGVSDEPAAMNYAHAQYKSGNIEGATSQYQKLVLSKNKGIKSLAYQQLGVMSNDPETLERALSYFKESIKSDPTNEDARYNYEMVKKKLNKQQQEGDNNDKQNQDDQNKDQENKDQENKDQENKDQNQNDQQNKDDQQQQDKNQSEEQKEDQQKQDQENKDQQSQDQKEQEGKEENKEQSSEEEKKEGEQKEEPQQKPGEEEEKEGDEKNPPAPSRSDKLEEMNISEEKAKMILEALKNSEIQYIQQNRRKPSKKKESDKPDW